MTIGEVFHRWLTPAPTKAEAMCRYRILAAAQALIALAMLALWASAPAWVAATTLPQFSALFLLGAAVFAAMGVAALGSIWLIRRDIY